MRRAFFRGLVTAWLVTAGVPNQALARSIEPQRIETVDAPSVALTPDALADALACRSGVAYRAFRLQLSGATDSISWMESYFAEESNGMLGMHAFRLEAPIMFYGRTVSSVFFTDEGAFVSLPRYDALKLVADEKLGRLPAKLTRQYYRFIDPQASPVLIAFEPEEPALSAALDEKLGLPHKARLPPDTIFVGCSYTRLSPRDFLKRAARADERLLAQAEIFARIARARSSAKP